MPRTALLLPGRRRGHRGAAAAQRLRLRVAGFQALLGGAQLPASRARPDHGVRASGMLALTGGLAAACFVKAFGISFLAMPRSPRAAEAREVPLGRCRRRWRSSRVACVALGLGALARRAGAERGGRPAWEGRPAASRPRCSRLTLEMPGTAGVIAPLALAAVLRAGAASPSSLAFRARCASTAACA